MILSSTIKGFYFYHGRAGEDDQRFAHFWACHQKRPTWNGMGYFVIRYENVHYYCSHLGPQGYDVPVGTNNYVKLFFPEGDAVELATEISSEGMTHKI